MQGSSSTSVALPRTPLCRGPKGKGQLTTRLTRPARQLRVALQVLSGRTQVPIARPLEARPPKTPAEVLARLPRSGSCLDALRCAGSEGHIVCVVVVFIPISHQHTYHPADTDSCLLASQQQHTRDRNNILRLCSRLCPLSVRWSSVLSFNRPVHTLSKWARARIPLVGWPARQVGGAVSAPPWHVDRKYQALLTDSRKLKQKGNRSFSSRRLFLVSSTCLPPVFHLSSPV